MSERLEKVQQTLRELDINFCFVSAIVERQRDGETEVLVQTRWKPHRDPVYSGTLEIQAGGIKRYENVYVAIAREVYEETGLRVTGFKPDIRSKVYAPRDDDCFAFVPFCCQQQLKGSWPRIGIVFICTVEDRQPVPQEGETSDIRWMTKPALQQILHETPEKIFTLQLGVLDYYLNGDHAYNT